MGLSTAFAWGTRGGVPAGSVGNRGRDDCLACPRPTGFRYRDEQGKEVQIEGRLEATGEGVAAVELADGEYRFISEAAAKRT